MASSVRPFCPSALPRVTCAWGKLGSSSIALRCAAMASVEEPLLRQGEAEVVMDPGVVRVQPDRLAVGRDGVVDAAPVHERGPEVGVGHDERGSGDRLAASRDGLGEAPFRGEGGAEVRMSRGEIGAEADGLLEGGDGFVEEAWTLESDAEGDMGYGMVRPQPDRLAQIRDRLVEEASGRPSRPTTRPHQSRALGESGQCRRRPEMLAIRPRGPSPDRRR